MALDSLIVLAVGIIGKNLVAQASGQETELGKLLDAVVGNRADAVAMAPWSLIQQLKQDRSPLTEQVTQALWLSYQQALLDIAQDCRNQLLGPNPQIYRGQVVPPKEKAEDVSWYNAYIERLQRQIGEIKQNKVSLPALNLAGLDDVVAIAQSNAISPLVAATNQLAVAPDMAPGCYGEVLRERLATQVYACFAQQVSEHEVLLNFVQMSLMKGLAQNDQALLTYAKSTDQNTEQLLQEVQEVKAILKSQSANIITIPTSVIDSSGVQPNPFSYPEGRIEEPELFFERKALLREIFALLNSGSNVELVGPRKIGKSSLLKAIERNALSTLAVQREPVYIDFNWGIDSEDDFYEALCHFLKIETCKSFALTRKLQTREPALLLLDVVEKMQWENFTKQILSQLRGLAEGSRAPLKLVMAASKPLDILFPDSHDGLMTSPIGGVFQPVMMPPWSEEEIQTFIRTRLEGTGVWFSEIELQQLIQNSRGNPRDVVRGGFELYARYQEE
ncbi:MAG: hypothetical protein AAF821_04110 [Cyanobacteria bacterium P01_D01_bin.156]